MKKGASREKAYALVQRNALKAWKSESNFRQLIEGDPEVTVLLSPTEIEECFNLSYHLKNVDYVLKRAGIL